MKLDKENKEKIDSYFRDRSTWELLDIMRRYGMCFSFGKTCPNPENDFKGSNSDI